MNHAMSCHVFIRLSETFSRACQYLTKAQNEKWCLMTKNRKKTFANYYMLAEEQIEIEKQRAEEERVSSE